MVPHVGQRSREGVVALVFDIDAWFLAVLQRARNRDQRSGLPRTKSMSEPSCARASPNICPLCHNRGAIHLQL